MAKYDQGGGCDCGLYAECQATCEHNPANKVRKCGTCRWRDSNRVCRWPMTGRMPQWVKIVMSQLPPKKPSNYGTKCNAWEQKV